MSKKFVLFIVEGNNDKRELDAILHSKYFASFREKYAPYYWPTNGDITAAAGVNANNIQKKINDILITFRKKGVPFSNVKVSDIQEIVQIVDLDGTFIPRANIVEGHRNSFEYTDDFIITSNVDGAYVRNKKKADILQKLVGIQSVGNVNYSIYFASCNMDHLLFDRRSLSQYEKSEFARNFQLMCESKPSVIKETIFKKDIAAEGSYYDSWRNIQKGNNSLQRHTNLNLYLEPISNADE
jgi:hypothetical protein